MFAAVPNIHTGWWGEKPAVMEARRDNRSKKLFKPRHLSHLCTAGQSLHKVVVNVTLSVLESYRNRAPISDVENV